MPPLLRPSSCSTPGRSVARLREVYARAANARAKLSAEVTTLHNVAAGVYDPQAEQLQAAEVDKAKREADPSLHRSREVGEQNRLQAAAQAYTEHLVRHGQRSSRS